eukprot:TRINITY_DN11130_c0_g1_i1.p1 TRINITY_DN11130_c0_g1~~TRINITY_DN11130_c0_g1_i1.p1  ORF type:complete len:329 (-),score=83.83 TRINITY_DN11130_c0_g1_i1:160-1146(-)
MKLDWIGRFSRLASKGKEELLGFLQRDPEENPHAAGLPFRGWGRHGEKSQSSSGGGLSSAGSGSSEGSGAAAAGGGGQCSTISCSCDAWHCFFWALLVFIVLLILGCILFLLVRRWQLQHDEEIKQLKKQLQEQDSRTPRRTTGYVRRTSLSPRGGAASASVISTPPISSRDPPVLDAAKAERLKALEAKQNVTLDLAAREIRPVKRIEFEDYNESTTPSDWLSSRAPASGARFATTPAGHSLALEILRDVAEIMSIYETAVLCVEGHSEERAGISEKQATTQAQANADLVKSTLVSFNVEPGRIAAVGLPGKLGSNTNGVALRITSF